MRFIHERLHSNRWVPSWLRHQNAARYAWAAGFVQRKSVLEVGCGTGHGCRILARAGAARVVGVDVDGAAIDRAISSSEETAATFMKLDSDQLPFESDAFDVVVSLETIEHVTDDLRFLNEIGRVLHPEGVFLCSTPNRSVTNPGTALTAQPFNPLHVREYTASELADRLSGPFRSVEILGQSPWPRNRVRILTALAALSPRLAVRFRQLLSLAGSPWDEEERHWPRSRTSHSEPEVLVAICGRPRPENGLPGAVPSTCEYELQGPEARR